MSDETSPAAAVLSYTGKLSNNRRRGHLLLPAYWLGIAAMTLTLAVASMLPPHSSPRRNPVLSLAFFSVVALIALLPASFGLSLSVWLRQVTAREVRYRGFAPAFLCGAIVCLAPALIHLWPFGLLADFTLSAIAGFLLCVPSRGDPQESDIRRKFQKWMILSGLTLLLAIGVGYASAVVSRKTCEQTMARYLLDEILPRRRFHLTRDFDPAAPRIFAAAGATPLPAPTGQWNFYPWADIGAAKVDSPFIVTIKYGWVTDPAIGEGATRRFLCLFGYLVELDDENAWTT